MSVAYTIRIPEEEDKALAMLAKRTERKKAYFIRKAITHYLQELKEDSEDLNDALKAFEDERPNISWEEVQRDCGLLED